MRTISGKELSLIGIGTFGIGGRGHRDVILTEKLDNQVYVNALVYTLQKGVNFTEISLGYGHGNALNLFKKALDKSGIKREDIFITHSLYPRDLPTIDVINQDIADYYKIMETNYADSTLVTQSLIIKFGDKVVYPILHNLLDNKKTRFVSLSNASLTWIKAFKKEFGNLFYAHEGHLSFEIRALQDKGVFETCNELGIKNIIWRPFRRNKTLNQNWKLISELTNKYNKTQSQIILNWICHLGFNPMVFSVNKSHIDENLEANSFQMTEDDYSKMNDYRPSNYHPPKVDWEGTGIDDDIVTLVKNFEKHIE